MGYSGVSSRIVPTVKIKFININWLYEYLKRADLRPYLHYPVFRRLENPGFFFLARVDYGTVTWPGDIDIAPETLYEQSVSLAESVEVRLFPHRPSE